MTYSELREKVEQQIAQLPLERLFLVSSFIDSIESKSKEDASNKQFCRIPPLKRNKKASDLLSNAGSWQGDDLAEVLILQGKLALMVSFSSLYSWFLQL